MRTMVAAAHGAGKAVQPAAQRRRDTADAMMQDFKRQIAEKIRS